jgi:hypothetical protein
MEPDIWSAPRPKPVKPWYQASELRKTFKGKGQIDLGPVTLKVKRKQLTLTIRF